MISKSKTFSIFLSLAAFAVLACAGASHAQTVRRAEAAAVRKMATIQVASVNAKSPTVDLKAVGRRVAPGVLEVNPELVRGRRLILPSGGGGEAIKVCIGLWDGSGGCLGIYIDIPENAK